MDMFIVYFDVEELPHVRRLLESVGFECVSILVGLNNDLGVLEELVVAAVVKVQVGINNNVYVLRA